MQVAMLFRNHNDLLEEFTYFLPDSTPPQQQTAPTRKIGQRGARFVRAGWLAEASQTLNSKQQQSRLQSPQCS